MWTEDLQGMVRLVALAALTRAAWETSLSQPSELKENPQAEDGGQNPGVKPTTPELPAEVERWKRKELRRYRQAQERKWRSWFDALYEPRSP